MSLLGAYPYQAFVALFVGYLIFKHLKMGRNSNPRGLPFPPGPKGYPLIGSLFDMPVLKPWLVYDEWCKTYGDMVYFKVLGQHFLILGTHQRINDLFEKKSANFSDRMRLPMLGELMEWDFALPFMPYGVRWQRQRKLFHEFFHPTIIHDYLPIQRREVRVFLRRLLITPNNLLHHIQHTYAATAMKIAYGIDVLQSDDPYVVIAEEALKGIDEAAVPGAFWVDIFPILKYVPSWIPGAGFQKKAAYWRKINEFIREDPFLHVKEQLKNGKHVPSVAATLIERLPHENDPKRPMEEKIAQDMAGTVYAAGAETTGSTVQSLFLAMVLYPEVQKKVQAEIDAVVGPNRLPDIEDRPSLPYLNAVIKETLRWHVVGPLAIPHMATNDDEYNGYYIPKGTVVFGNLWSILHDPEAFDNPMDYQPERYMKDGKLNPDVRDPYSTLFGFGRRICPGRHLSDNSLYLIVSCLLAVYDLKPPVNDKGIAVPPKAEFTSGMLSYPAPFKCIITPRTPAAEALIWDSVSEYDLNDSGELNNAH